MTLKERLDAIWDDPHICSPSHLNIWSEAGSGYQWFCELGLFWKHGKLIGPKPTQVKGKGYSFLPKFYGMAYWFREGNK